MDTQRGNSALRAYLQSKFPPLIATQETDHHVAAEVTNHMFEEYKVNTKSHKDLFLFKYDQTLCERWDLDFVNECRGILLRRGVTDWIVESRPFDKFFNQNEGESPVKEDPQFNALCKHFNFVEKADGTCIQLWYDDERAVQLPENKKYRGWRVSTLGTITPQAWVTCLFWRLLSDLHSLNKINTAEEEESNDNSVKSEDGPIFKSRKEVDFEDTHPVFEIEEHFISKSSTLPDILKKLNTQVTYLFEMCCKQNEVVTQYERDKLFVIGAREILTGRHYVRTELDQLASLLLVDRPRIFPFAEHGITTLKQAKEFVEQQAKETIYGKNPEGFVVYYNDAPLCKLKNKSYVEKHGIVTGDLLYVRNVVIDRFFEDTLDDVIDVVTQPAIREFLKELKIKVQTIMHELDAIRQHDVLPVVSESLEAFADKKNYVPFIQKTVAKEWQPFFLMNHKQVLDLDVKSVSPFALPWIKKCYFKFKGYWKNSNIPELVQKEMAINRQVTESDPLTFKFATLNLDNKHK